MRARTVVLGYDWIIVQEQIIICPQFSRSIIDDLIFLPTLCCLGLPNIIINGSFLVPEDVSEIVVFFILHRILYGNVYSFHMGYFKAMYSNRTSA